MYFHCNFSFFSQYFFSHNNCLCLNDQFAQFLVNSYPMEDGFHKYNAKEKLFLIFFIGSSPF